nr:hypothetical protein [Mucilaginibacter sp. L294]
MIIEIKFTRKNVKRLAWMRFRCFNCFLVIVLLLTTNSCVLRFKKLTVETKEEKVNFSGTVVAFKEHFRKYVSPNLGRFNDACRRSNVTLHYSIIEDSIINFEIGCPDLESANNLMTTINDIMENAVKRSSFSFNYSFNELDNMNLFTIHFNPNVFADNGKLIFNSKQSGIIVPDAYDKKVVDVLVRTDKQAIFSIYSVEFIDTNVRTLNIYYPRKIENTIKAVSDSSPNNVIREPILTTDTNDSFWNRLSIFFEEHLWARISAVLGSIASIITIVSFRFKK